LFNRLIDFYEIQLGGHAIKDDLKDLLSNPVPATFPKWRKLKVRRLVQNLHQSTWNCEIPYSDRSSKDEQLLLRPLRERTKIGT
jgi:hypothetical protein